MLSTSPTMPSPLIPVKFVLPNAPQLGGVVRNKLIGSGWSFSFFLLYYGFKSLVD